MKLIKGLFAFILVLVIIGGIGYIGYSYYFINNGNLGMNANMNMNSNEITSTSDNSMQSGMPHGSMDMGNQQENIMIVNTVKDILSNKESLDNAVAALNDSLSSLTLDPYSPTAGDNVNTESHAAGMNGMQMPTVPETTTPDTTAPTEATTINIYPDNSAATNAQAQPNLAMMDMGTSYDPSKMEQLHKGLYKLSSGMQVLDQLNNELLVQAEAVRTADTQNPTEYYTNQYTQILQNKSKLNQAINDINEAENLVNINPYISDNGIVYDKARMISIHESIFKMAEGMALLNQLNAELVKQAIRTAADEQAAISNLAMNTMQEHSNQMNTPSPSGVIGNLNLPSLLNIVLIVFAALFVFGLIGAILSMFKTPQQNSR